MKIPVSADALHRVLTALSGPSIYILEIQVTRGLSDNPIDTLIEEYNAAVKAAKEAEKDGNS